MVGRARECGSLLGASVRKRLCGPPEGRSRRRRCRPVGGVGVCLFVCGVSGSWQRSGGLMVRLRLLVDPFVWGLTLLAMHGIDLASECAVCCDGGIQVGLVVAL